MNCEPSSSSPYDEKQLEDALVRSLRGQVKRAKELETKALRRLQRLRQIVRNEAHNEQAQEYIDEIIKINEKDGGGELLHVNTPDTRAWFLRRDESWIYIERENDSSFSLLYSVKKLYKSKYLIQAMAE
ncbi:unnamed protein product [Anisakis simplex]|uniref:WSD domain-containing protein n=1 Tax=Anisakis simplex TaxID=6269 RepID=A0A0M3J8D1_ANISI|nr:unnamed protein product [Anisakis simplex]